MSEPRSAGSLVCWNCGKKVKIGLFEKMSVLHGRPADRGGPYLSFRCPECRELWICYRRDGGTYRTEPPDGKYILETLLSWFSPTVRQRLTRVREWMAREGAGRPPGAERRALEEGGDGSQDGPRNPGTEEEEKAGGAAAPGSGTARPDLDRYRKLLGVGRKADLGEVRRAFRRRAKECHPDRLTGSHPEARERARLRFAKVREAYEKLRDALEPSSRGRDRSGDG